jgi:hypothetical protein
MYVIILDLCMHDHVIGLSWYKIAYIYFLLRIIVML